MLAERPLTKTGFSKNSVEPQTPSARLLELSQLKDGKNFRDSIAFLNKHREKFDKEEWKEGLDDKQLSIKDVGQAMLDINRGREVSSNSKFAIWRAFEFAGASVPDRIIARVRERAEIESLSSQASQEEKKTRTHIPSKKALRVAAIAPVLIAIVATKPWEYLHSNQVDLSASDNNEPRNSEVYLSDVKASQETDQDKNVISNFLSQTADMVESVVNRIPLVEEKESPTNEPYNRWGIDFSDTKTGATLEWNSEEIIDAWGEPLTITVFPVPHTEGVGFGKDCRAYTGLDCSRVNERAVIVGGHTSHDYSMEDFRAFSEGWTKESNWQYLSPEVREQRITLMESNESRPTLTNYEATVQPKAAIVRIPPAETDKIYNAWFRGEDITLDIALSVDPELVNRVNLEEPLVVYAGCGRKLSGDSRSPSLQPNYQATLYLVFLGEAPGN